MLKAHTAPFSCRLGGAVPLERPPCFIGGAVNPSHAKTHPARKTTLKAFPSVCSNEAVRAYNGKRTGWLPDEVNSTHACWIHAVLILHAPARKHVVLVVGKKNEAGGGAAPHAEWDGIHGADIVL